MRYYSMHWLWKIRLLVVNIAMLGTVFVRVVGLGPCLFFDQVNKSQPNTQHSKRRNNESGLGFIFKWIYHKGYLLRMDSPPLNNQRCQGKFKNQIVEILAIKAINQSINHRRNAIKEDIRIREYGIEYYHTRSNRGFLLIEKNPLSMGQCQLY